MSDSEFEPTVNSCSKRKRLRSLPPSNKTSELFASGGFLDSQTTDTQWEDNLLNSDSSIDYSISQLNFQELQKRQAESLSSASSGPPSASPPPSAPAGINDLPSISLAEKVYSVVELHMKEVEEDARRQVEAKVRTEVDALRGRVDFLCQELHHERNWIRTLEVCLHENNVTFPSYARHY